MVRSAPRVVSPGPGRFRRAAGVGPVEQVRSNAANRIPAVEHWDWTWPDVCGVDHLWTTCTHGRNAGGIGGDNRNAVQTEVVLGRLPLGT
ncbi:MAG: hypothetical protein JXA89_28355 [Anaerolineae bacterium]|nr:hypothetical protein [Anaerolineae bacterium]